MRFTSARGDRTTTATGADGIARAQLPAGTYRVEILAGCTTSMIVTFGGSGQAQLAEGDTLRTPALKVSATRRYWPGGPIDYSAAPPWPTNSSVTLTFTLYDRCDDSPAPRRTLGGVRVSTDGPFEVDRTSFRADRDARASLVLRCTKVGNGRIEIYDPHNPTDRVNLMSSGTPFGQPWCTS